MESLQKLIFELSFYPLSVLVFIFLRFNNFYCLIWEFFVKIRQIQQLLFFMLFGLFLFNDDRTGALSLLWWNRVARTWKRWQFISLHSIKAITARCIVSGSSWSFMILELKGLLNCCIGSLFCCVNCVRLIINYFIYFFLHATLLNRDGLLLRLHMY